MELSEYERMQPHVTLDGVVFLTPNQHCAWRVQTLYTKEPDTIEWINKMSDGDLLFDVGACMGGYSLYAANRGIHVHAFEPESQNFALLCRNIAINKMGERIRPWPMALSDMPGFDLFHVQSMLAGGSCSSYGEEVNFHLQPKEYAFHQGCSAITLDQFSAKYGYPDHIKIDVDGLEHKIIAGAFKTLQNTKSVLVELNTSLPEHVGIYAALEDHGFRPDVETAEVARRKEGPFTGIGNVIFYRK